VTDLSEGREPADDDPHPEIDPESSIRNYRRPASRGRDHFVELSGVGSDANGRVPSITNA